MISVVRQKWHSGIAIIVFVLCLNIGHWLSQRKPLWNDEIYTQVEGIEMVSYKDIILGRLEEGNNNPLFYLIQKGICDLTQYRFPQKWEHEWNIAHPESQFTLRISSNVFMSFAIALIYYFFARYYSGWVGFYALLVTLSSSMIWAYWVEARPYPLWIVLTTIQSLLFLTIMRQEKENDNSWQWLGVTHILLSLTIVFGIPQILIVSFLLWVLRERTLKKYILLTGIPVAIGLFYYLILTKSEFQFQITGYPLSFISSNIPQEQLLIVGAYVLFLLFYCLQKRMQGAETNNMTIHLQGINCFVLTCFMFLAAVMIFTIFKIRSVGSTPIFDVPERYFVFLTPIGILATTLFSVDLFRAFKGRVWIVTNIVIVLGGLLAIRMLRTYLDVVSLGLY